jgi:hypothetical protein
MKRELSRQIFEKSSNITIHRNLSSGIRVIHADGQTDRHDEANSRSSQFVNAPESDPASALAVGYCENDDEPIFVNIGVLLYHLMIFFNFSVPFTSLS